MGEEAAKYIAEQEELMQLKYWEAILDEELWQDGELDEKEVAWRIVNEVMNKGNWTLIRRKEE